MAQTSAEKWKKHDAKQKKLKRKRRYPYLTNEEWLKVKQFIKEMRGE